MFSFVGYEYHPDSALLKPLQERWLKLQELILCIKSKRALTTRCLMSLIGLLASAEKMVPEGCLHMRSFQFHLQEHWRYRQPLNSLLPWSEHFSPPRVVVKSRKGDEGLASSPPRPQYPNLYRRLYQRLGISLRASLYKRSVVRQGK